MTYLVDPTYEFLSIPNGQDMLQLIEQAARTCYKSENKITEDSAKVMVRRLLENGHLAMIEFGHDIVVKFTSNRGFTHELVRHRISSLAQESTRYCNYSKGKFDGGIRIIPIPNDWLKLKNTNDINRAQEIFTHTYEIIEQAYMELVGMGVPAQIARELLPIGLKAEICIKANPREWRHIFSLRCSKKAHPRMRELMIPLLHDVHSHIPVLYDDLAERFPITDMP